MKYKAFTVVELIVVILIIGIISTVGFISFVGYAENSRDAARINNITKLEKTLEIRKTRAGEYPTPENSSNITYLGKTIWTQGVIGSKTKQHLNFQSDGMDPKFDVDYSYSVTENGKRFEIGTIMENETNNSLGFLLGNTFANGDSRALTHGNFKGKFYSTKINGETHIFSLPSLILNDSDDFSVEIDVPTDRFSITGESSLPESYSGVTVSATGATEFTPRLLYSGPNCGVETDLEIVNFIAILRDSFNYEPYVSNNKYQNIFKDYNILRNDIDDFETLQELGLKINESLGCNIKKFKATNIFPPQCGNEGLDFEGVSDGFDIGSESCLFQHEGIGTSVVTNNVGVSNSKGLTLNLASNGKGSFNYRVFSYEPMKFNFKVKTDLVDWSSYKFYINDVVFTHYTGNGIDGPNGYQSGVYINANNGYIQFTSPLLKPGLYDFKWESHKSYMTNADVFLDDLEFTCVGGGTDCGWEENTLDEGNTMPWDIFDFEGDIPITWKHSTDASQGSHSITNPMIPVEHGYADIVLMKTFDQPQKISFDLKTDLLSWSEMNFLVNDIEHLYLRENDRNYGDGFKNFTSVLLPAGEYEFKWRVRKNLGHRANIWLDNIEYTCIGGGIGCGIDEFNMDLGATSPLDVFVTSGRHQGPWIFTDNPADVNQGTHAITNPTMSFRSDWTAIEYTQVFDSVQKFNFDFKTAFADNGSYGESATIKFYIDGAEYLSVNQAGNIDNYETYTTPLLGTGSHTFQWKLNVGMYDAPTIFLDNFRYSCIGGGVGCGWLDANGEDGPNNPADIFSFEGHITSPWHRVTGIGETEGTYAITNPNMNLRSYNTQLIYTDYFDGSQKFSFDYKGYTKDLAGGKISLYLDGVNVLELDDQSEMSNFTTYTSEILPIGEHTYTWTLRSGYYSDVKIFLDNFKIHN